MSSPQAKAIEDTFLFHYLAVEPDKVLPPGKSLLSVISRPPTPKPAIANDLQAQVEVAAHRAFWDEARETLSSPLPSVQLPRLRSLYLDLLPALRPLFPENHRILAELAAPVPPTSSPLHSAIALLEEILKALRERCAPIRDPDIDHLLDPLQSIAPVSTLIDHSSPDSKLSALVVDTIRSIVALAPILKEDLSNALLAGMSDTQLAEYVKHQARHKEREVILGWNNDWNDRTGVSPRSENMQALQAHWNNWLGTDSAKEQEIQKHHSLQRLMSALFSSTLVSCTPGDTNANSLPPQFFFLRHSLFDIQNQLQALVIVASLLTLLKSTGLTNQTIISAFLARIWSLLKLEIDEESPLQQPVTRDPEETDTKLINLEDEVIRTRRMVVEVPSETEEQKIRAAVQRTLRLDDPVFKLLQRRLQTYLGEHLYTVIHNRDVTQQESSDAHREHKIPQIMKTGRNNVWSAPSQQGIPILAMKEVTIKGYEDDLLRKNISDVLSQIVQCIQWLQYTWGDTILI